MYWKTVYCILQATVMYALEWLRQMMMNCAAKWDFFKMVNTFKELGIKGSSSFGMSSLLNKINVN